MYKKENQDEVEKVLISEAESNSYIRFLSDNLEHLSTDQGRLELADYGMNDVQDEENHNLASYFFVLSSVTEYNADVRDFFQDVMVHCEDQMSPLENAVAIHEKYQNMIRPTLT